MGKATPFDAFGVRKGAAQIEIGFLKIVAALTFRDKFPQQSFAARVEFGETAFGLVQSDAETGDATFEFAMGLAQIRVVAVFLFQLLRSRREGLARPGQLGKDLFAKIQRLGEFRLRFIQLRARLRPLLVGLPDGEGAASEFGLVIGVDQTLLPRLDFQSPKFDGETGAQQVALRLDLVEGHGQAGLDARQRQPPRPPRNQGQEGEADQAANHEAQNEIDDLLDQGFSREKGEDCAGETTLH